MAYSFAPFPITFSDVQDNSPIAVAISHTFMQQLAIFLPTLSVARSLWHKWASRKPRSTISPVAELCTL